MIPETFDLKLIQETAEDFDRVAQFYRDAIDQTPEMERFGRWIYGLQDRKSTRLNSSHRL